MLGFLLTRTCGLDVHDPCRRRKQIAAAPKAKTAKTAVETVDISSSDDSVLDIPNDAVTQGQGCVAFWQRVEDDVANGLQVDVQVGPALACCLIFLIHKCPNIETC